MLGKSRHFGATRTWVQLFTPPPPASLSSHWPICKDGTENENTYLEERSGRKREIMYAKLMVRATEKARRPRHLGPRCVFHSRLSGKNEGQTEELHRYTNAGIWS